MFEKIKDKLIHHCGRTPYPIERVKDWMIEADNVTLYIDYCPYCGIHLPITDKEIQEALDGELEKRYKAIMFWS
jgi:hypothetical protein